MPGQGEGDSRGGGGVEGVGVVGQEDRERAAAPPREQVLHVLLDAVGAGGGGGAPVEAEQVDALAANLHGHDLIDHQAKVGFADAVAEGDAVVEEIVVADAHGQRGDLGELAHGGQRRREIGEVEVDQVTGEDDQVGVQVGGGGDDGFEFFGPNEATDVGVGDLSERDAVEGFGKLREGDLQIADAELSLLSCGSEERCA